VISSIIKVHSVGAKNVEKKYIRHWYATKGNNSKKIKSEKVDSHFVTNKFC